LPAVPKWSDLDNGHHQPGLLSRPSQATCSCEHSEAKLCLNLLTLIGLLCGYWQLQSVSAKLRVKWGISEDAVRQRSKREGWMASPKTVAQRALAKPVTSVSPDVLSPADALANVLQEHERETKLSLARSARRMAKNAEQATLREAPYVHKAAQVASITHSWGEKEQNPNAMLNVAILTGAERPERAINGRECQDSGD
jgi:hypothetical protein